MYAELSRLLSDKKDGAVFTCFGAWHLCYILALAMLIFADFFFMPFAYGKIDIEKLPFHICTAMCVMFF